ncbi:IS1 OrfB [Shigella flexneri 2a]|nr:IS1 OrfB [Shigella flexneri 2a]
MAHVFGERTLATLERLLSLLSAFEVVVWMTDGWPLYESRSLLCGNIRQVRHPDLIWCCRSERLVQQIWRNWQIVVRVRSRSELAFLLTA